MAKRIMLTGGSGMLGSAILEAAANTSDVEINAPSSRELNLLDQQAVEGYLRDHNFDAVIHAAAKVAGIQANIKDPAGFLAKNNRMNLNIIEGAHAARITKLLNVGSSCMYPKDYSQPLKESYLLKAPLEPTNEGYALAKIAAAKHCEYLSMQYGVAYKTIVPSNLYGPADDFDPNSSHLIAAVLHKLHQAKTDGESSVVIWGDGSARREFLFIKDLSDWLVGNALDQIETLPSLLNLGLGHDYSVLEYYEAAARIVGYAGNFEFDLSKPVGMRQKLLDSSLAAKAGWRPSYSLESGLQLTYQHYLDHLTDKKA